MVIDRSGTSENVYMMSLVDENDLAEFLDETKETEKKEESAVVLPETTTTPEPETTAQPETEAKQESGINKMIGWIALGAVATLALGGLGMFAFGKLRKKKEDGIVEEGLEFADDSYINESAEITKNHKVWRKGSSFGTAFLTGTGEKYGEIFSDCRETKRGTESCKEFICISERGRLSGGEQLYCQLVLGTSRRICTTRNL